MTACSRCGLANPDGASFCNRCGERLGGGTANAGAAEAGERRPITVLFCDLVGSTALTAALDLEDLYDLMRAYQEACAATAAEHGGYVAKFLGDGVLVYFGYPRALERAAEQAVRCGLAIVGTVARLGERYGRALAVRVGVATSVAVIGEPIGSGSAAERSVIGDAPNLGARLQAFAEPGEVVVADATRSLVRRSFDLEDLGAVRLKGFALPQRVWRVIGERSAVRRRAAAEAPLVGRGDVMGHLDAIWRRAAAGRGQMVWLEGEAGIGKSRIAEALLNHVCDSALCTYLRYYGQPATQATAFQPILSQLERAARLSPPDAPADRLDKLRRLLARGTGDVERVLPLFASLLSIPVPDDGGLSRLAPQRRKELTIAAMVDQLVGLSAESPVLVIFEDLHWIDPTTLAVLSQAIERIERLPVMILATTRPEAAWRPPPGDHVHRIELAPLDEAACTAIVEELSRGRRLPADLVGRIVHRTEGIPLFVEEMTKDVLEAGLAAGERPAPSDGAGPDLPVTLHDSLAARLDRLGPAKRTAQICAVLGREFRVDLLRRVAEGEALQAALDALVGADLIVPRGSDESVFAFKHALIQDAAYSTLLKPLRRQLHARAAQAIERFFPDLALSQPEVMARHLTSAGLHREAAGYWLKAGQLSMRRSALDEAVSNFRQGLQAADGMPEGPDRDLVRVGLLASLGTALIFTRGFGAPEVEQALAEALRLCDRLGSPPGLVPVLWGIWSHYLVRGKMAEGLGLAERLRAIAAANPERQLRLIAAAAWVVTDFCRGDPFAAKRSLAEVLDLYDPAADAALAYVYSIDPKALALCFAQHFLWMLGETEAATRCGAALEAHAERLGIASMMPYLLVWGGAGLHYRRDAEAVGDKVGRGIAAAEEQRQPMWAAAGRMWRGWALVEAGRLDEGIESLAAGLEAYQASGSVLFAPYLQAVLAEAHARRGEAETAGRLIADTLARIEDAGEQVYAAEIHRLAGLVSLQRASPDREAAAAAFERAIRVAEAQQAPAWRLRAAISLARLERERGRAEAAASLLSATLADPACRGDPDDLAEAGALLAGLRSG